MLLVVIGPLTGQAFRSAVSIFAEASGANGQAAALPQEMTPLDGIFVPAFGGFDLAVTLLLPFVAIRLIAHEKENGTSKLMSQFPFGVTTRIIAKIIALCAGWAIAWGTGLIAIALWKSYGGHIYWPETLSLILGHWLRMLLSAGIGMAAAALTESAASAAIVTLTFTLGTWALDFLAQGRGGWIQELAAFTPTSALRYFEQGLVRSQTIIGLLAFAACGFVITGIWLPSGRRLLTKVLLSLACLALAFLMVYLSAAHPYSWDVSENLRNSFPAADETALRKLGGKLQISVNLAAEDPRLMDYERSVLTKLRRVRPELRVEYTAGTRTGLFEGADEHYGEIWYELNGRRVMNRSTTVPIVIQQLYELAGTTAPEPINEPVYPGFPLAASPRFSGWIFYVIWPALVCATWLLRRRGRPKVMEH